jgi:hypothetical protein
MSSDTAALAHNHPISYLVTILLYHTIGHF